MRKALLYLLLVAYITVIGKPAVPAIADAIAHVCWYSEHMATVHYENGKYHVHAENIKEAKKSKTGQDEGLLKDVSFFAAHIIEQPSYGFELLPLLRNHFGQLHCTLLAMSPSSITPPPRA